MDETITVEGIGTFTCVSADGCSVDLTDGVITTDGDITVVSLDVTDATILAQLAAVLPPEPVELNELETAQADAAAAATAAMTAAGNAETSATAATEAVANLATVQTGETSRGLATKAGEQAALAHAAYMTAKTASDVAEAATDVTAAVRAQVDAENALADATAAETMAGDYGQMAMDAAGNELMIVDTAKTVGGTSIDATAPASEVTAGVGDDAQTTRTGLLDESMNPEATGPGVIGDDAAAGSADNEETAADDETAKHVQAVAARTFDIGKVVDSADDTARLMIVTQYAGTTMVPVYSLTNVTAMGTKAGYITIDDGVDNNGAADDGADLNNVALKSEGTWYQAGGDQAVALTHDLQVGMLTEGVEVFSYVSPHTNNVMDRVKTYVVSTMTVTADGTTTDTYTNVNVTAPLEFADPPMAKVRAAIPEATDYEHIHFGAWAALGEAEKNGTQKIADLGIGFVQSIGDGLTGADMPNNGDASYTGNWVGTVRAADEDGNGPIVLESDPASMVADFGKGTVKATLTNLATLEGDIAGNTFSGDEASDIKTMYGLDADGEFTGEFSGGFYGAKAAEAGGVFAFTSEDEEAGEFRGAFGADRD